MKLRLVLLASYFVFTPFFILFLISVQVGLRHQNQAEAQVLGISDYQITYNNIPETTIEDLIIEIPNDKRVDKLISFFSRYNSPLEEYADEIVDAADRYGLDYRLVPSIAMQESTLCLKAPKGLNNCWGYGIYGTKKIAFDDLAQAIEQVSKTLAVKYHAQGLEDPHEIMTKYTPSNDGEWADNVEYVMERIETNYN